MGRAALHNPSLAKRCPVFNRKLAAVVLGCFIALSGLAMPPRAAAISGVTIAIVGAPGGTLKGSTVTGLQIVTYGTSQVDTYYKLSATAQIQYSLHLTSTDQ